MRTLLTYIIFAPGLFSSCSTGNGKTSNTTEAKDMSSTVLKLIPVSPEFIPGVEAQNTVRNILQTAYKNENVELTTTEKIEFIDQGENFESVSCNLCKHELSTEDWQEEMDKAFKVDFTDLTFTAPCCNRKTSLNELHYNSAAGFSKFVISISDPSRDLTENELKEIEIVMNSKIRKIWGHY